MKSLKVQLKYYLRCKSQVISRMLSESLDKQSWCAMMLVKGRDTPTRCLRELHARDKKLNGILISGYNKALVVSLMSPQENETFVFS